MGPRLLVHPDALFVKTHSPVYKSETDTSNRTFRIRFAVHYRVVPGQVAVNRTSMGI
jgi:hypothetical protein